MVADLEAKWGMTLLERSKRGVCLTSAGEQVLPFLRKVLNDHAELEGQIYRMNRIETGVVRIGTFASVAIHWLPNIFSALQRDYPGIGYEMLLGDYDEVERWIGEGRGTAAFCGCRRCRDSTRCCSSRTNTRWSCRSAIRLRCMRAFRSRR